MLIYSSSLRIIKGFRIFPVGTGITQQKLYFEAKSTSGSDRPINPCFFLREHANLFNIQNAAVKHSVTLATFLNYLIKD